jgi:hypothetical protein
MKKVLALLLVFLILIGGAVLYISWAWGGEIKDTLDPALMPTARYLLDNPLPTPEFINSIDPPPGSVLSVLESVCLSVLPGAFSPAGDSHDEVLFTAASGTRIIINSRRLARNDVDISILAILTELHDGRPTGQYNVCIKPLLPKGLHTIEIQIRDGPLGRFEIGEVHSHIWAYELK